MTNKTINGKNNVSLARMSSSADWRGAGSHALDATKLLVLVLMLLLGLSARLAAQGNAEGYIYGAAPGADRVTVTNLNTNLTRSASVAPSGSFSISPLPVGTYKVVINQGERVLQTVERIDVRLGSGSAVSAAQVVQMAQFDVVGLQTVIDASQTGVSFNITKDVIDDLPIERDLSSIMLLSPGVVKGDGAFGSVPSFAGASVAENNYFLNGFNITNFRTGTDYSRVPFDFQQDFQIQVGGYGAQYGRSLGGISNVTSKSGGNRLSGGVSLIVHPDRLQSDSPRTFQSDGSIYSAPDLGETRSVEYQAYASGPIIKNRLFFFALYNGRSINSEYAGTYATSWYKDKSQSPFWGGKIDLQLSNSHLVEFTVTSDERTTERATFAYDYLKRQIGASRGTSEIERGGRTYITRYSGSFGERLKISGLWGKATMNLTSKGSGDSNPLIYDFRTGALVPLGSWSQTTISTASDHRKQYRLDADLTLGRHQITLGSESEDNVSNDLTSYSGGVYWRYYAAPANGLTNGVANSGQYARKQIYNVGGSFKVKNESYYIADEFRLFNERALVSAGLRNEAFKNYNKNEEVFIGVKNQWAPRLSFSFDPDGKGKQKYFANYGRYFIPIASNTNIRASGGELYTQQYYTLNSINGDGTPNLGAQLGATIVNATGIAPNAATLVDLNIKPMYQDEVILGYQREFNSNWSFTVRGMVRDLKSVIDDTDVLPAITAWAKRTGNPEFHPEADYVLFNPGGSLTFMADAAGNGKLIPVTLSAADLNMPAPIRKYYALQFETNYSFSSRFSLSGSYTWSHNYGNFEGWVKSDNEQNDPGISAAYDAPAFMTNTYGNLPNDRRHVLKGIAYYRPNKSLTIGITTNLSSGRPINKMGQPVGYTGVGGYANAGMMLPRASLGVTPWVFDLDTSLSYRLALKQAEGRISLSINNVLDRHTVLKYNEFYEDANHTKNLYYGIPREFQSPRSVRASFSLQF